MFKSLTDYVLQRRTEYPIRIKLINPKPFIPPEEERRWIEALVDKIERHLEKYGVLEVSPPEKTIFHSKPLDFPDVDSAEVYIIDAVLSYPVAPFLLQEEFNRYLLIPLNEIVVRLPNEPIELAEIDQQQQLKTHDIDDDGKVDQYVLLDTPNYDEVDNPDQTLYAGQAMVDRAYKAWKDARTDLMTRYEAVNEIPVDYPDLGKITSGPETPSKEKTPGLLTGSYRKD